VFFAGRALRSEERKAEVEEVEERRKSDRR
jgi:hypothetical protein